MPLESVVITGVGPVSAVGCGRDAFWDAMVRGEHGFGPITLCDATHSPSKIAAEVSDFRLEDYVQDGHLMARHTPRPVQFALAAGVLALHDSELDLDACDPDRFGTFVGTSIGNLSDALSLADRYERTKSVPAHAAFHAFNHSAACVVSSFFNIRGPMHTTSSGCNSGLDAIGQAMRMLQAGAVDAMLVIGTDCEVVPEVLAALNASGSLATKFNKKPGLASRPFDKKRDGNVIGEGAAGLVLETESHAKARNARIYARLVGYQICSAGQNRTYSHDRPDVDLRPCTRALRGAIREAGWEPHEVEMISANGSSSVHYDRIEAMALREVFGKHLERIPLHSTKSMLGQHGAGSSALQVVSACLSIRRGSIPPTINCDKLDPKCGPLNLSKEVRESFPTRALVHAIGLGGFYYSVGALESLERTDVTASGAIQVSWSADGHPRFQPSEKFREALKPWRPRTD